MIDDNTSPHKVLLIRGWKPIPESFPECAKAAARYLGSQRGEAWVEQQGQ
jgi:hypothetical protein